MMVFFTNYLILSRVCNIDVFRRPFHFTPLHHDSPYDPTKLGFLLLTIRGALPLPWQQALSSGEFTIREEAKSWPMI